MIEKKKVVIFGAGGFAAKHLSVIENYYEIKAFCDNDPDKKGLTVCGKYMIYSVSEAASMFPESEFLVALNLKNAYKAAHGQLEGLDVRHRHVNDALFEMSRKNDTLFFLTPEGQREAEKIKGSERNIFVLTAPPHSNLGDQAQAMCAEKMLGNKYSGRLFIYDEASVVRDYFELLYIIKRYLKPEDMVFLHSGYRLTNLYMESVYAVEMMMELLGDKKMVFLPQTIHFTDDVVMERLSHEIGENVTIMCRDSVSLKVAKEIFNKSKNVLCPDLVTSLIGKYHFKHEREGILFCLRTSSDGESLLSDDSARDIAAGLREFEDVIFTDTTIDEDWNRIAENRVYYVEREIDRYSHFKILITNRFHGMVFALAANTPVIVLPTKDHKVTAGALWFNKVGYRDVFLCKDDEEIKEAVAQILNQYSPSDNSDYFYRKYFEDFDPWNIMDYPEMH